MNFTALGPNFEFHPLSCFLPCNTISNHSWKTHSCSNFPLAPLVKQSNFVHRPTCFARMAKSDGEPYSKSSLDLNTNPSNQRERPQETKAPKIEGEDSERIFPTTIPKKRRRGRKSEASAVEDFIRDSLERTFASIREQNPEILKDKQNIIKDRVEEDSDSGDSNDLDNDGRDSIETKMVVEDDDPDWPLDADVGWGIRASEYFDKHPIKNVVGEDGDEIDWEGEIDDNWVKEINCLEWERFTFHPSPLVVLVFERYNRASKNWKLLKELEKAVQVYLGAKHLLPPRTVKIDINIERDLAYALKVKDCPQILFLRGHKILYREKEIRTADELVQMIAYFYFNAKKPSCINDAVLSSPI